ncbi:methanogenic corrinoid protein MtbC1 [Alkalibaculum bacchi]|uniref:Methanogenic corrinoid protein MtbC1 n=1 Tax=Alkalibaculum bacchi TaxID=645887 RepID=A0A366ICG5_9FIRM|nr:cobalamin-dependent protein [Alkalibaculum bacchi]RBP68410.1 methanogenic corrinoid protein MtbC1 [Alkalibaculum bacchi]
MILEDIQNAIGELDEDLLFERIDEYLGGNPTEESAWEIIRYSQKGTRIVGDHYHNGIYFLGDLIYAGELMTEIIDKLKPYISHYKEGDYIGKMLIGTVQGDLHDIGKNIFKGMSEAAGFQVYDIGIDQSADAFVEKAHDIKPDIIGLSGVLTLAIDAMKRTVDVIKEAGLRSDVKIIVGGTPLTDEAAKHIGADAYSIKANEGVEICRGWMEKRDLSQII